MARRKHRASRWREYVPQSQRHALNARDAAAARARGETLTPVRAKPGTRQMASTVWGRAWCDNLERYHDFANRLPRGRTYARNGAVVHLEVAAGRIDARVRGSDLYRVTITIAEVARARWKAMQDACATDIGSLVELLEGRLSASVMAVMTAKGSGLFPEPREIQMQCSCPDWATMCKHVAAVMYGVGVRLDDAPALLFVLRGVDPTALVGSVSPRPRAATADDGAVLEGDLGSIFGIDLLDEVPQEPPSDATRARRNAAATKPPSRARGTNPRVGTPKPKRSLSPRAQAPAPTPAVDVDAAVGATRATSSAKPRSRPKSEPTPRREITRKQLIELGLSASTISSWYDRGVLESAGRPGVYRWTETLARRIAERAR